MHRFLRILATVGWGGVAMSLLVLTFGDLNFGFGTSVALVALAGFIAYAADTVFYLDPLGGEKEDEDETDRAEQRPLR
ncbi:MAG: hypothetical protein HKN14_00575 [Marinicaulis sp.]|nr:hypothetical protein [Marinicaulis sp.]NNL87905.1 hypothetical protein [Marinicaulis sp.]